MVLPAQVLAELNVVLAACCMRAEPGQPVGEALADAAIAVFTDAGVLDDVLAEADTDDLAVLLLERFEPLDDEVLDTGERLPVGQAMHVLRTWLEDDLATDWDEHGAVERLLPPALVQAARDALSALYASDSPDPDALLEGALAIREAAGLSAPPADCIATLLDWFVSDLDWDPWPEDHDGELIAAIVLRT